MKLNRRLLLAVLPLTLACALAGGFMAYTDLKSRVIELEEKTLNTRLTELSTRFNQYRNYIESYLHATVTSEKMQRFIRDVHNYRELSQRSSFQNTLTQFNYATSNFFHFSIVEPTADGGSTLLEIVKSEDPFAGAYESLRDISINMLAGSAGSKVEQWSYVTTHDGKQLIVLTRLIDQITFENPLAHRSKDNLAIQFALEPTEFLQLLATLKHDYPVTLLGGEAINASANGEYGKTLYFDKQQLKNPFIRIVVDDVFLQTAVIDIQRWLILVGVFAVSAYIFLTLWLINRYITHPIARLERDIAQVANGEVKNISHDSGAKDEINNLARSFSNLYGRLSDSYAEVTELTRRDHLTGLYNLPYISEIAVGLLEHAAREQLNVAVFYIDLDNFKFVNDQYGHYVGDELLKKFSKQLTSRFRGEGSDNERSFIARLGGDEFCVIYRGVCERRLLDDMATRILTAFEIGFAIDSVQLPVSASVGVALYPDDGATISELISAADTAMYAAKSRGKNEFAYYNHDLWLAINRRQEIENCLKSCDPDTEFELVFMPLVDGANAKIEGFETLIRWNSSKLGWVSPAEFVPIAESCGLFVMIDQWVVKTAFRLFAKLDSQAGEGIKLAINISSAQLSMNGLTQYVMDQATHYKVNPASIRFEITETMNVEYNEKAASFIKALTDRGFHIAIDDFGNGYTSLVQLVEFPATMIKFDKTFIEKTLDGGNRNMLRPLIDLCHSQNLEVTAEGVETREQAEYLLSLGVDVLQGYYFGKPVKIAELPGAISGCRAKLEELAERARGSGIEHLHSIKKKQKGTS